jgi:Zn-dependent protease with chaperone function
VGATLLLTNLIFHSLWQGALIAAALWALLRALGEGRPQLRYLAACTALALLIIAPLLTALSPQTGVVGGSVFDSVAGSGWLPPLEWVVAFWFGGVSVLSLRLIGGGVVAARLRRRATRLAPPELQRRLLRLMQTLQMRRPLRLYLSERVDSPLVIGWLKPVILLPVGALSGLTPAQVEALLAHELAHIRRHDALVNALQTLFEVVMFYHPATWWISRTIRREREHCCDEIAAQICGHGEVAGALTRLEELRQPTPLYALSASDGSLLDRIRRLVGAPPEGEMRFHWIGIGFIVALLLLVAAAGFTSQPDTALRDGPLRFSGDRVRVESWRGGDPVVDIRVPEFGFRFVLPAGEAEQRLDEVEQRLEIASREIEARVESIASRVERFGLDAERRSERGFDRVGDGFETVGDRLEDSFDRAGERFDRIGEGFERFFGRLERSFDL